MEYQVNDALLHGIARRNEKRRKIQTRYAELKGEGPVTRTQTMNREFGPYWYFMLPEGGQSPPAFLRSERYKDWTRRSNPKDPLGRKR